MSTLPPKPAGRSRRWVAAAGAAALVVAAWWLRGLSPSSRWAAIEAAVAGRRWAEAEARLDRWLVGRPGDGRAWSRLGGVRSLRGRGGEALDAFGRVGPADPDWPNARMFAGEIHLARHEWSAAERAFRDVAGRLPNAAEPRRRLVFLLTVGQRVDEARAAFRELHRLTGESRPLADLVGLGLTDADSREMTRAVHEFLRATPADPWVRRAWGMLLLRGGRAAEARPHLEAAADALERDPAGRLALADCRAALGDLPGAEAALGPEPDRPGDRARWWLVRGAAREARGDADEALACGRRAAGLDPRLREAQYRLGQALARRGRADEARPLIARAEALRARQNELIRALGLYLRGDPSAETLETLGALCRDAGWGAEARVWYGEAIRRDPTRSTAQRALARRADPEEPPAPGPRLRPRPVVAAAPAPEGPAPSPLRFEDVTGRAGVDFRYESGARPEVFLGDTMGGGVGLLDYDGDGRLDLYFVNGCPLPVDPARPPAPNALYRNNGDGTFADVTARAGVGGRGYGMGCAVGDYDNDGRDDLFVTGFGRTVLYHNDGDGRFTDVTARAGVGSALWTTAAGFADLDGDGDLDLVAVTYVEADPVHVRSCLDPAGKPIHCPPGDYPAQPDLLFRNNGDGTFTDVSRAAGLDVPDGRGLGLAIADLDGDGRLDLFVANDAVPDFLFRNLGGLKFEEVGAQAGVAYDGSGRATASMGVVADDLDGDGRLDLFHTNFLNEPNTLLRNLGGGQFLDTTAQAGLDAPSRPYTGFGTAALDADNDGALDLFVSNGHVDDRPWAGQPMAQLPQLFRARAPGHFEPAPAETAPYFARPVVGRGVAAGDLDNDGRVDLVVVHRDRPAALLRNTTPGGHWLGLRLVGTKSGSTPVGARAVCKAGGRTATRWRTTGTSYLASNDPRLWFGLGAAGRVERLDVRWPSGREQSFSDLGVDRVLVLREGGEPADDPVVPGRRGP